MVSNFRFKYGIINKHLYASLGINQLVYSYHLNPDYWSKKLADIISKKEYYNISFGLEYQF